MKRGTYLKIKQLGAIIISWLIIGFFIAVYDYLVLHTHVSMGPAANYSFLISILRNMGAGLIGGLLGGSILVFYVNEKFNDKPYGYTILIVGTCFIFIILLITLIMGVTIVPWQTGRPLADPMTKKAFFDFVTDSYPLKNGLVWAFIVSLTQLLLQVSSKFGHQTFLNIITGKYNVPKKEKRIFMFLDLNSSTSIAEQLGNETYHALLKDFFADITYPILENKGNIYQYVGDEVVIAWNYKDGIENTQCLKCFFDIKMAIDKKRQKYIERYDLIPTFKAGIHSGNVIAGEIGIIKRDITYSGDVLNTTSRILGKCGELNQELIISSDLLSMLNVAKSYQSKILGHIPLKGKQHSVPIHALLQMK
ncbi:adenylate/guanylate cyclase domain-containing protein [Olivibacter sp. SDN3]|uniref:adenylate/guanylate cyclase domain-containing protein n=1 Tax=Olivibacter sp. SDN3 TaxID=2764720 RepID=UPI0016511E20|nr:adenylate/guanylate cyclase domain-containing protein [Olivibacter sp. SDN3]QNL48375.1 adenylate/guanylate cyclase domain-containing protein [Olivibacter sp. SDN3]